jgi:hypothetical protein
MKIAEDWLKENCKKQDWDFSHENLKDFINTTDVIEYMEKYSNERVLYFLDKQKNSNPEFI